MEAIKKIQKILEKITPDEKNKEGGIFINAVKNEFITFPSTITVPKISVKELSYEVAGEVIERLCSFFPEFFIHHCILPKRKPASDVHSIHFMRTLQGKHLKFVHFLKVDLRFGGDSSNVVERGNTDTYPSYLTNRMYYKSRLVPVEDANESDFSVFRVIESIEVVSDMRRRTFAMFDEVSMREFNNRLLEYIGGTIFSTSQQIYPFFVFDFFTPCLNVPRPTEDELKKGVEMFEPVFIYLYQRFSQKLISPQENLMELFPNCFNFEDEVIMLSEQFIDQLKSYFSRYSIIRDDELALRGWWKLEINPL
ncbi:MAG: hypothetical protein N2316_13530 [Spirochaetes bacterium]|nr:hypothetical protein [Spirochaetota bacterium]